MNQLNTFVRKWASHLLIPLEPQACLHLLTQGLRLVFSPLQTNTTADLPRCSSALVKIQGCRVRRREQTRAVGQGRGAAAASAERRTRQVTPAQRCPLTLGTASSGTLPVTSSSRSIALNVEENPGGLRAGRTAPRWQMAEAKRSPARQAISPLFRHLARAVQGRE
jgi:hypothetical protein